MRDEEAFKDKYEEHLINPKNYGNMDEYDARGIGKSQNKKESVEIYLRVENDLITDIKFEAFGCTNTVVIGSMFTHMIKGHTMQDANAVMISFLKGIQNAPSQTKACGEIVAKAFTATQLNYKNRLCGNPEDFHILSIGEDCEADE